MNISEAQTILAHINIFLIFKYISIIYTILLLNLQDHFADT